MAIPSSSAAGRAVGWRTHTPPPERTSTSPLAARERTASRITVRLTPSCAHRRRSGGSFSPGRRRPAAICPLQGVRHLVREPDLALHHHVHHSRPGLTSH